MTDTKTPPRPPPFRLHWTIGFAGKRRLSAEESQRLAGALIDARAWLQERAGEQDATLTAVSSIARGADVAFAQTVHARMPEPLQWKCVLPFARVDFLEYDMHSLPDEREIPAAERAKLQAEARECLARSSPAAVVTSLDVDAASQESRDQAYLECSYRMVDESDVVIVALREGEIPAVLAPPAAGARPHVGSSAVAHYAIASGHPTILLNVDAESPWQSRTVVRDPTRSEPPVPWFRDPVIAGLLEAARAGPEPDAKGAVAGALTSRRAAARALQSELGGLANAHRDATVTRLRWVIGMHLSATLVAALGATVLAPHDPSALALLALGGLVFVASLKPLLVTAAWLVERSLHHEGTHEGWVLARVLAETTRGAVALWPFPTPPDNAIDEEDFPHAKRLVRSLRLWREGDRECDDAAATVGSATAGYVKTRIATQSKYYREKRDEAGRRHARWRRGFFGASLVTLVIGVTLIIGIVFGVFGSGLRHWLEAVVIVAPFAATYCLATMSILDLPRRASRYREMADTLDRIAKILAETGADRSRLRLVARAERLLIEEQHEWFSVMRNLHV